jgi:hypothetical protein
MGRARSMRRSEGECVRSFGGGGRSLGTLRRTWEDNVKMDVPEIGRDVMGRVEPSCEDGIEPSGSIKCLQTFE